jgi:hypothetical protein
LSGDEIVKKNYLRWSEVPYAGEKKLTTNPVTPSAGSWSLNYLKRDKDKNFLNPNGTIMHFPIKKPSAIDFENELKIVQRTLKHLTHTQEQLAIFYGTGAPTKQWTPIIDRLVDTYGVSPVHACRILAAVQMAINDTMIVVWELKYKWDVARPNQFDEELETVICTPRFPSYPSGHASMSGCAEVVLSYFFPMEAKKLRKIAFDDAYSRLYAGVHFEADNTEGLNLGRYIGNMIVDHLKTQKNEDGQPIDHPYREYRNANISPDDYKQFIPFDFKDDCTSRLRTKKAKESKELIESIESIESSIESIESIDDQKSHQKHIPRRSPWHF